MGRVQCIAISLLSAGFLLPLLAKASSMSCQEFDSLSGVNTHEDFKHTRWTGAQFEAFKPVIADHVHDIPMFSSRKAALKLVLNNKDLLSYVMSNALSMTIDFCVDRKRDPMSDVAIEQFDYLLDAVASGKNAGQHVGPEGSDLAPEQSYKAPSIPSQDIVRPAATSSRFQCRGTYSNFDTMDARDVPVSGAYVEVSDNHVIVKGSVGFNATYSIINRQENGIGFMNEADPSFSGFFNRLDGKFDILQKNGVTRSDGSFKVHQSMSLACQRANALF